MFHALFLAILMKLLSINFSSMVIHNMNYFITTYSLKFLSKVHKFLKCFIVLTKKIIQVKFKISSIMTSTYIFPLLHWIPIGPHKSIWRSSNGFMELTIVLCLNELLACFPFASLTN